ncbi:MAG: hypothetical protein LBS64_01750 [Spirochaetaceae bacterium]|jgi:hypothetical protein|nr:hypothetical protein [Spirochaetaceae bacterium]
MISFNDHLTEKLKDPQFKKAYDEEWAALQREYQELKKQKDVRGTNRPEQRIAM